MKKRRTKRAPALSHHNYQQQHHVLDRYPLLSPPMVEKANRYSPIVAACLKDTSTLVRQQILESLTSLIKEQFIRWEGQIMYRFVSTILDENKSIKEYTKFCLLSTFDDTRKFTLMAHICTQIICPVMNGKLKFEDPCVFALLKDSLTVMSLKEIKLNMDVGKGPDEEDEPPAIVVAAAKEMIAQTFRKAMIEYVMPALLDLRVFLNERRSSLRGPLYCVFR
ncbi:hypothetical protein TELCIR_08676, partial [Teladorsagia circumcincta]